MPGENNVLVKSLYILFPIILIVIYLKLLFISLQSIEKDVHINTDIYQPSIKK